MPIMNSRLIKHPQLKNNSSPTNVIPKTVDVPEINKLMEIKWKGRFTERKEVLMNNFFKRYEKKYRIDAIQYEMLMNFIESRMEEDSRSGYTIKNLYYDTDNYDLIRASVEKPAYKEKLRLRTYDDKGTNPPAFIELKKKEDGIVYKRRFKTTLSEATAFLGGGAKPKTKPDDEHTLREIIHFLSINDVSPKAFISYDRKCLRSISDPNFRMTFDSNIVFKNANSYSCLDYSGSDKSGYSGLDKSGYSSLEYSGSDKSGYSGLSYSGLDKSEKPVLEPEKMIMEIKTPSSIPVWLSKILSELEIYPSSFSKYGEAYKTYIQNQIFVPQSLTNKESNKEVILSA